MTTSLISFTIDIEQTGNGNEWHAVIRKTGEHHALWRSKRKQTSSEALGVAARLIADMPTDFILAVAYLAASVNPPKTPKFSYLD